MALDDELRHFENNAEAKQRAMDRMRPVLRSSLAELLLDGDESDLADLRDMLKEHMRARTKRQERVEKSINEILLGIVKYLVTIALGALAVLFGSKHFGGGS